MSAKELIEEFGQSLNVEQSKALVSMLDPSQQVMFNEILRRASTTDETLAERVTTLLDWARSRIAHCGLMRTELHATEMTGAGHDHAIEIACYETEAATLTAVLKQLGFS